jgi:hypothetical protein
MITQSENNLRDHIVLHIHQVSYHLQDRTSHQVHVDHLDHENILGMLYKC